MTTGLIGILFLIVILAFMSAGSVLLVKFMIPKAAHSTRVLSSILLAASALLMPIFLMGVADGGGGAFDLGLGLVVGGAAMSVVVCWPVAHFATKRLDRLTEIDVETFA